MPGGRSGSVKFPLSLVTVACSTSWPTSTTVTLALRTTAPEGSVTVPSNVAFTACPRSAWDEPSTNRTTNRTRMDPRTCLNFLYDIMGSLRMWIRLSVFERYIVRTPYERYSRNPLLSRRKFAVRIKWLYLRGNRFLAAPLRAFCRRRFPALCRRQHGSSRCAGLSLHAVQKLPQRRGAR